jgi:hypothetical protein
MYNINRIICIFRLCSVANFTAQIKTLFQLYQKVVSLQWPTLSKYSDSYSLIDLGHSSVYHYVTYWILASQDIFLFSRTSIQALGPPELVLNEYLGFFTGANLQLEQRLRLSGAIPFLHHACLYGLDREKLPSLEQDRNIQYKKITDLGERI